MGLVLYDEDQVSMEDGSSLLKFGMWLLTGFSVMVAAMAALLWDGHGDRIKSLEQARLEHEDKLAAHIHNDTAAHDRIKESLTDTIHLLHTKIDSKTDALGRQMTTQHEKLRDIIIDALKHSTP